MDKRDDYDYGFALFLRILGFLIILGAINIGIWIIPNLHIGLKIAIAFVINVAIIYGTKYWVISYLEVKFKLNKQTSKKI